VTSRLSRQTIQLESNIITSEKEEKEERETGIKTRRREGAEARERERQKQEQAGRKKKEEQEQDEKKGRGGGEEGGGEEGEVESRKRKRRRKRRRCRRISWRMWKGEGRNLLILQKTKTGNRQTNISLCGDALKMVLIVLRKCAHMYSTKRASSRAMNVHRV
jgi:hypothetical protein